MAQSSEGEPMELVDVERAMQPAIKKKEEVQEGDDPVQSALEKYYQQPQNEIQFDYLYVTPGAPEAGFSEWTRDSILSNYNANVQTKIGWCVEEIRILEMMKADAIKRGDAKLIDEFITPLIRFNTSEKFSLENTSRNIGGYNAQISRSQFNMIQQMQYNENVERQKKNGMLSGFKLPRIGGGRSSGDGALGQGFGWDTL